MSVRAVDWRLGCNRFSKRPAQKTSPLLRSRGRTGEVLGVLVKNRKVSADELVPVAPEDPWLLNLALLERMAIRSGFDSPYGEWRHVREREPGETIAW